MGASLRQPWRQSADLVHDLNWLRDEAQCELVATVTDAGAESCRTFQREPRVALLFGNEGTGLSDEWLARCSRRITVPMAAGFDSLNVAVAAGILLYELSPLGGMAQKKGADQAGAMP